MLVAKKEPINWATWFSQTLQNELVGLQRKAGKLTNTLVRPALTIIGYYYQELFAKEQENVAKEKKKLQKQEKIIVDVNAIMLEKKERNIISNPKQRDHKSIITSRRGRR
jgi:hypothetical protein